MVDHKDLGIFRRFAALDAQDLIYLQAELSLLDMRLRQHVSYDSQSEHERQTCYSRDWQTLSMAEHLDGATETRWQTFLEIREKLAKYREHSRRQCVFGPIKLTTSGQMRHSCVLQPH
jgi:hypothetical protein